MDDFVPIASSAERPSLERLEKYLVHHGIPCRIGRDERSAEKYRLLVASDGLDRAKKVLDDVAFSGDMQDADETIEIRFDGSERLEVAAWLQILLDEQDREGSPVYFFRSEYEAILDELHASGRVDIPLFILKGLASFIPPGAKRAVMGPGLQDFFGLIESITRSET